VHLRAIVTTETVNPIDVEPMCGYRASRAGADPENELEGANSGGLGGRSPPEADDFSQLKGYLDVTSGILGAMAPWPSLIRQ